MNLNEELNNVTEKVEETAAEAEKTVDTAADTVKGKVQELLDKTDIDEKIVDGAKNVIGKIGSLFGKDKE